MPADPGTGTLADAIDRLLIRISDLSSWIWLLLLAVIVLNVTLRYLFSEGRIELEEIQWHLYAIGILAGLAGGVANDSHIRVDVLHERFSPRLRAWVELYGLLLLFLPFCILILVYSVPFVAVSFTAGEVSQAPGGLGGRWLIKAALPVGFGLLTLAGIARLLRAGRILFHLPGPAPDAIQSGTRPDPDPQAPAEAVDR